MQNKQSLLNAKQVAERLNVSVRLALKLLPEMHPINVGAGGKNAFLRVRPEELDKWLARRVKEPEPAPAPLTLAKPKPRKPLRTMFPQPINGRIPTRKEAYEQLQKQRQGRQ